MVIDKKLNLVILLSLFIAMTVFLTIGENTVMAEESDEIFFTDGLDDESLQNYRGMVGFSPENLSSSTVEAVSQGNVSNNSITGDNIFTGNALEGANGVISVIQNTGNNVAIGSSTIINVTLQ